MIKELCTYSPVSNCRGGQLPNIQFFSSDFNLLKKKQSVKILKKSDPPIYCQPPQSKDFYVDIKKKLNQWTS